MKGLLRTLGCSFIALSSYAMASEVNYYVIADQARPFQIEQQGEQHSGIVTDIVSAIFAESDYEVKYHTYPFKRMISAERMFPDGSVIEIIGNPMPGGGFVMSFTDISAFREAEKALQESNESLERRVNERTRELSQLNQALLQAQAQTERASQSKSRFLTAVSHDLMQPLNAARLFSASLAHQADMPAEVEELVRHLDSSLASAEELISDLLDISRLEAGRIVPELGDFALSELFDPLRIEFSALAVEHGIDLRIHSSRLRVRSDMRLLRRVLQNFLTNAFRYASAARVVLGVRHLPNAVRIEVWDQGPGIPQDKLQLIFEEHYRTSERTLSLPQALRRVDHLWKK